MTPDQAHGWPTNIEALHGLLDGYQAQVVIFQRHIAAERQALEALIAKWREEADAIDWEIKQLEQTPRANPLGLYSRADTRRQCADELTEAISRRPREEQ